MIHVARVQLEHPVMAQSPGSYGHEELEALLRQIEAAGQELVTILWPPNFSQTFLVVTRDRL